MVIITIEETCTSEVSGNDWKSSPDMHIIDVTTKLYKVYIFLLQIGLLLLKNENCLCKH